MIGIRSRVCRAVFCLPGAALFAALMCVGCATLMSQFPEDFTVWQAGIYHRFSIDDAPEAAAPSRLSATVCRNAEVVFQLAACSSRGGAQLRVQFQDLVAGNAAIPKESWRARFVDYVHTSEQGEVSDSLADGPVRPLAPNRIQPIWLTLPIPKDCVPGMYEGTLSVQCDAGPAIPFPVRIEVLNATLPDPSAGTFYLDLWQHPGAIARYHDVALWSAPHWALIRAYTRLLAEAGQNPITACIIHDPWASQTYDPHASMVEWIRNADRAFSFDFSVFDRYVELCFEEGFTGPINCYSAAMGPGKRLDCPIRYWDREKGCYARMEANVGDEEYRSAWRQFYAAFVPHLKEKGWFENTCIAIDEAPEEKMRAMLETIPSGMKIALAGDYHPALDERIYDYCIIYPGTEPAVNQARRERGQFTTFYTCTKPDFPNTFSYSPPIESRFIGWNALRQDLDGYLRWAFASWPENPLKSSVWEPWQSGDTFLVYPGPRSSVRFELLKQGIQDFEAWHLARKKSPDDPRLAEAAHVANVEHDGLKADPAALEKARDLVNALLAE